METFASNGSFSSELSDNLKSLPFVKEELDSSFNTSLSHSSGDGNGHYLVYYGDGTHNMNHNFSL